MVEEAVFRLELKHAEGILNGTARETPGSHSAPFCITTRQSAEEEAFAHLCARNNYVEINLFK